MVEGLGYIGIRSRNLEDWAAYATRFLGMQLVDKTRAHALAAHGRPQAARHRECRHRRRRGILRLGSRGRCGARCACGPTRTGRRRGCARQPRARRRAPRQGPDRLHRSDRQPARSVSRRRGQRASRSARAAIFRASAPARSAWATRCSRSSGSTTCCRSIATCSASGLSDYILKPFKAYFFHVNPRHHSLALHRDRQERHPPHDGRAVQPRRCRAGLRHRADRPGEHRLDLRPPHQRST